MTGYNKKSAQFLALPLKSIGLNRNFSACHKQIIF